MVVGTLFIVATPIGNMGDLTFRAKEILETSDLIVAEDTRTTKKIFNAYEISTEGKFFGVITQNLQKNLLKKCF